MAQFNFGPAKSQTGVLTENEKGAANGVAELDSTGKVPSSQLPPGYTLPLATNGTRGGVQIGYAQSGKNYPVQLSSEKMYVNVPWTADGGNAATVSGYTVAKNVPADAVFTDHYAWSDITSKPATATRWPAWSEVTGKPNRAGSDSDGGPSQTVKGEYTGNGGKQNPNYFGLNKVGFLMMNTTVNGDSNYKDWIIMDCYGNNDVGGGVAFGVNRQVLGAYIMRSAATRTSWAESAELIGTHNYTTYTVKKDGTGASGTWGINITGNAATVNNHSVNKDVPSNADFSNTWRPVQNNLTSTSTTDSLSAAMGKSLQDNKVAKSGDTMTGNLTIQRAGESYCKVTNTNTGVPINLDSAGDGNHGLWSSGYYNGSSFVSNGKWICYRSEGTGKIYLTGTAENATNAANSEKLGNIVPRGFLRTYINYNDISSFDTVGADNYLYSHSDTGNTAGGTKPAGSHNGFAVLNTHSHSGNYCQQLGFDIANDCLWYRTADDATTFTAWRKLLSSTNYTDYTVTKTGSGASGTWGINITGSAAVATTANYANSAGTASNATTANSATTAAVASAIGTNSSHANLSDLPLVSRVSWGNSATSARSSVHHIVFINQDMGSVWCAGTNDIQVTVRNRDNNQWISYQSSSGSVNVSCAGFTAKRTDGSSSNKITITMNNSASASISIVSL